VKTGARIDGSLLDDSIDSSLPTLAQASAGIRRRDLETFLANPYVELLPVTLVTAERFGRIATGLKRKGRPLPTNDIWVAAHAMESGAELLSFDSHFAAVDGLAWSRPAD